MALPTSSRNFPHVQDVLDEAVARGGARYTLPSDKEAIRWRLMAYHFRKLVQKENAHHAGMPKGMAAPTAYDGMYLTLEGATVVIQFHAAPTGQMTTLEGSPITPQVKKYEPKPTDDLIDTAEQVKKDLGL